MEEASAQPAVAPPPGHPRFPHVDALRAIAALTVIVYHSGYATSAIANPTYGAYVVRANVGVTLFFLISGFLLYRPFVAHRLIGAPGTRLRDYARRRLLRILPAYWLALTVLAIWPGLPGVFTNHWWIYYGFAQAYNAGTLLKGIGPAWTLCVEVTFYAFLPLYAALVAGALRGRSRRVQVRAELALLLTITVAVVWYRDWLHVHDPISPVLFTLPAQLDWFAAGMAMAVLSVALQAGDRRPAAVRVIARAPWLAWLGAVVAFWAVSRLIGGPHPVTLFGHVALLFSPREDVGLHLLDTAVAAGLLIPAVFGTDGGGWVRRLLLNRQLAWLGLISYGIYLWQQPLLNKACQAHGTIIATTCGFHGIGALRDAPFPALIVIAAIVSIICAAASYYLVERPVLRLKNRRPGRPRAGRRVADARR